MVPLSPSRRKDLHACLGFPGCGPQETKQVSPSWGGKTPSAEVGPSGFPTTPARNSSMDRGAFAGALGRSGTRPLPKSMGRDACGGALGRNGTSPLPPGADAAPEQWGLIVTE